MDTPLECNLRLQLVSRMYKLGVVCKLTSTYGQIDLTGRCRVMAVLKHTTYGVHIAYFKVYMVVHVKHLCVDS